MNWERNWRKNREDERHWHGRYMEICEVALEKIECSLFSCPDDDWEIYVSCGIMFGISFVSASEAVKQREQMKKEIEEEYEKSGLEPSEDFVNRFAKKYMLDIDAFFGGY